MSRIEKKTKIRYLPAKVQLTENSALTGSYPTVARTAGVDNRSGRAASFYSDVNTVVFSSASVPSFSPTDTPPNQFKMNPGQDLQPFYDSGREAVDGKSSTDPFWTTGSNFDGLRAPLWSKHKIEIDITPITESTITADKSDGFGAIYNFDTKQWMPGGQSVFNDVQIDSKTYRAANFGFTPAWGGGGGQPFSNFGFPWYGSNADNNEYYNKFLFKVSTVIDKPFLVEKIYVQLSASYIKGISPILYDDAYDINGDPYYETHTATQESTSNFYILNKRADCVYGKTVHTIMNEENLLFIEPPTNPSYTNDLVTWFEIGAGAGGVSGVTNTGFYVKNLSGSNEYYSSWSQNLKMSGSLKIPNYELNPELYLFDTYDDMFLRYYQISWQGGRNGIDQVTSNGRDFVNANLTNNNGTSIISPYFLMPGDSLSFNWQMPMPECVRGGPFNEPLNEDSSSITFAQHPAKVILYGTYLSENKETNETLNQVLSSDTVHEAL